MRAFDGVAEGNARECPNTAGGHGCHLAWLFAALAVSGWLAAALALYHGSGVASAGPYKAITGLQGHLLPEMDGRVPERTIWLYWNRRGTIPPFVELCIETIKKNRGSFEVQLLYQDDVDKYVSRAELPVRWRELMPAQQKDSLMNALLARYGGVAMDATTILFEPLDSWWEEMVNRSAIFRGFMYEHVETAVWFLMARKETLFRSAVTAQVIGMGDDKSTWRYSENNQEKYFALGDGTITPILALYDFNLRRCFKPRDGGDVCYPPLPKGEELGPEKLMLSKPDDSAQLPYAVEYDFPLWSVGDRKAEWQQFLWRRGWQGLMPLVKMFQSGGPGKKLAREKLLAMKGSFFCHFLCVAGHDACGVGGDCGTTPEAMQA